MQQLGKWLVNTGTATAVDARGPLQNAQVHLLYLNIHTGCSTKYASYCGKLSKIERKNLLLHIVPAVKVISPII